MRWISRFNYLFLSTLGPYHEKHIFPALYIYKLVLPEPANSLNEENKRVLQY